MQALGFHHFVEQRNVERHDRDGAAGLRDQRLVDRDEGAAARGAELLLEPLRGRFEVFLGAADGAVAIDGPGEVRPDVAVGHGDGLVREHARRAQRVDPHLPILAAHHRDGIGDLLLAGRLRA